MRSLSPFVSERSYKKARSEGFRKLLSVSAPVTLLTDMARTLVLNRSFRAVAVADWQRAVTLVYMGLAEALDDEMIPYDFQAWIAASSNWVTAGGKFVSSPSTRFAV